MKKITGFLLILAILMSVAPYRESVDAAEEQLIFYESFENGLLDYEWQNIGEGGNVFISDTVKHEGSYSLQVKDELANSAPGVESPLIAVKPGYKYRAGMYINAENNNMRLYFKFFDKSKNLIGEASSFRGANYNQWDYLTKEYIAPETAAYAQIALCGSKLSVGGGYFDCVSLYELGRVNEYDTNPRANVVAPVQSGVTKSNIIKHEGNKLVPISYSESGNTLSDFSYAGFYAGEYEIPNTKRLKVAATLSPSGEESDNQMIQAAINSAAASIGDGEMAVVKLKAGRYNIDKTGIKLKTGVVLSGEGQGPTGTILYAKDAARYTVVEISGSSVSAVGSEIKVTTSYIKSGSKTFEVENASTLQVGDLIRLQHNSTKEWDKYLELENLTYYDPKDGKTYNTSWEGKLTVRTERTITKIEGNKITVDFPFFIQYENNITPLTVYKINDSKRIKNSGVENLRILSYFDKNVVKNGNYTDDNHALYGIRFYYAKDCFAQNVTVKHIKFSAVYCANFSKRITIRNCSGIEPVSTIAGSERYSFGSTYDTQQVLITGCYSHRGRHDFETSYTTSGPYAFVDNLADNSLSASETHGTWSTGILYDNLIQIDDKTGGFIASSNRGVYGTRTSQGWSGAGVVIWNSLASAIIAHKPSGDYQNFMVGVYGVYNTEAAKAKKASNIQSYKNIYKTDNKVGTAFTNKDMNFYFNTSGNTSLVGDCYKEGLHLTVNPQSIFKAQLAERVTGDFNNAKPTTPVIVYPKYDALLTDNFITVAGFCNMGTEKVTVYIDDVPYNVPVKEDYSYEITVNVKNGVHKIYATRTVGGVEGNKTADRFVTVNRVIGNDSYLQSMYAPKILSQVNGDTRKRFAEPEKIIGLTGKFIGKAESTYKFQADITEALEDDSYIFTAAFYDARGNYIDGAISPSKEGDTTGKIVVTSQKEIKSVKFMLWESKTTLNPVSVPYILNLE